MRIEPPPSLPRCSGPMPVAAATAAPALLPPGVRSGFQGLRVMPVSGLSPTAFQPNSGVVVLPSSTAPCSRRRATMGASSSQGWSRRTDLEPRSVGQPRAIITSFTVAGTPSTRPCGAPLHPARLRRPGGGERGLLVDQQEGVERGLQRGDAGEHRARHLHGRQRLAAVVLEQRRGAQRDRIVAHAAPLRTSGQGDPALRLSRFRSRANRRRKIFLSSLKSGERGHALRPRTSRRPLHRLELVDHALDHAEALLPELALARRRGRRGPAARSGAWSRRPRAWRSISSRSPDARPGRARRASSPGSRRRRRRRRRTANG